jgi:UTP:GlnB (protein PII) uridylyltransferase
MDTRSLSLREQCQEFVARTDKRILSHYSPSVLYHHAVTLDRVRRSPSETPFELALINEKVGQPLYHFVFSCKDSPGLFGRFYDVFRQRQLRLTSAYLHTIDGFVSDYLTVEPRYPYHQFVGDDLERLTAALAKTAYDVRQGLTPESTWSSGGRHQRTPRFELLTEETDNRLILTISDCIEPQFMGRLLALLEVKNLEIKGAKLRAGNRQQRYVFFLKCKDSQPYPLDLLTRELRQVLSPDP